MKKEKAKMAAPKKEKKKKVTEKAVVETPKTISMCCSNGRVLYLC